jgi:hypothetical protein
VKLSEKKRFGGRKMTEEKEFGLIKAEKQILLPEIDLRKMK